MVVLTDVRMAGEIVAGYPADSMALPSDGFHVAALARALGVAALLYGYARRRQRYRLPASTRARSATSPFSHRRWCKRCSQLRSA